MAVVTAAARVMAGEPICTPPDDVVIVRPMTVVSTVAATEIGSAISRVLVEEISKRSTAASPVTVIEFTADTAKVPMETLLVLRTV